MQCHRRRRQRADDRPIAANDGGPVAYCRPLDFPAVCHSSIEGRRIEVAAPVGKELARQLAMQFRKRKVDGAGGHPLGILLLLLLLLLLFSGFLLSQRDEVGADETLRSPTLNVTSTFSSSKDKAASSGVEPDEPTNPTNPKAEEWTWFNGDLNQYYNKLERDEHAKRKPEEISSYAVHRWLGKPPNHSTLVHYQLVRAEIYDHLLHTHVSLAPSNESLRVFDAGCGLGAGLMWFEQNEPQFELVG